jgi:hypothetical protein
MAHAATFRAAINDAIQAMMLLEWNYRQTGCQRSELTAKSVGGHQQKTRPRDPAGLIREVEEV